MRGSLCEYDTFGGLTEINRSSFNTELTAESIFLKLSTPKIASTSGISVSSCFTYLWPRQPDTITFLIDPSFFNSTTRKITSIASRFASSIKAHVLIMQISLFSVSSTIRKPSFSNFPIVNSESTRFLAQPKLIIDIFIFFINKKSESKFR